MIGPDTGAVGGRPVSAPIRKGVAMDDTTFPIDPKDLIAGLGKGLRVIESFDEQHPRLTPTEAGQRAGITRTAARRYLLSLAHFGYCGTDGKRYWLQPRVLRLGQSYLEAARMPRMLQPFLQRAALEAGEPVDFHVLDAHDVLCVARSAGPRWTPLGHAPGTRLPAHCSLAAVAVLASGSEEASGHWIAQHDFRGPAAVDPDAFAAQVRAARAAGHVSATPLAWPGLRGVAVAVRNREGHVVGAMGTLVAAEGWSAEQATERLLPALRDAAQSVQQIL